MPTFTDHQKDMIRARLGYPPQERVGIILPGLNEEFPLFYTMRVTAILDELDGLDTLQSQARCESMATELEDLKLNYAQHIRHLRSERIRLIQELCDLLGLKPYHSMPRNGVLHYQ